MTNEPYTIEPGDGPLVATAIHAGHDLQAEVADLMVLEEPVRRREEDPFTDGWTVIGDSRVVVHRSRFEVDLNRPVDEAICCAPEDCWDLCVWGSTVPEEVLAHARSVHHTFYTDLDALLRGVAERHGAFVLFDLHSYNHRRDGPCAAPADPAGNPQVNVGTGSLDRGQWGPVVDAFIRTMRAPGPDGRALDTRENVRFRGGYLSRWVNDRFGPCGCALAIDVKKFFMDEHADTIHHTEWSRVLEALRASVPAVLEAAGAG